MTYIAKPKLHHPSLVKNKAGYTRRDYEGAVSTLCGVWVRRHGWCLRFA